ncbi:hypothetical protein NIES4074_42230 [Cylindrospermum sp. NIES-4074]|nr:hypothetical protein NIES4074_42230 [Cylindrospermum sp. NIES-4074]
MMIGKQTNKQKLQSAKFGKKAAFYLRSSQRGFTIVESLVAILVVSILLAAIAPVIALSVATRVQSRRVELASQSARAYIDGVRTKKISLAPPETGAGVTLSGYSAPTATGTLTCTANSYCTVPSTTLYCLDFDGTNSCEGTSTTDMIVQAFRYNAANSNSNIATKGYALGVRVYRADAFKDNVALITNTKQATFAGGAGQRKAPLVEMTADINDTLPKYSDLCARLTGCN